MTFLSIFFFKYKIAILRNIAFHSLKAHNYFNTSKGRSLGLSKSIQNWEKKIKFRNVKTKKKSFFTSVCGGTGGVLGVNQSMN